MFVKVIYLYLFYCVCCYKDRYTYMAEDKVVEERYPDLNEKEDLILDAIREKRWREFSE